MPIVDGVLKVEIEASQKQRLIISEWMDENSEYDEIGFGGARGGGKTWVQALTAILETMKYPNIRSLLIRKGMSDVIDNYYDQVMKIAASLEISDLVQWRPQDNCFLMRHNGSRIQCGYLSGPQDVNRWQGIEFARMHIEEATQLDSNALVALIGSNRPNNDSCKAKRLFSMNPGGPGHQFIKDRFVNAKKRESNTLWVPCLVTDSPQVLYQAPHYVRDVLSKLPPFLRRQWLSGDWDALSGQFWTFTDTTIAYVPVPAWANWYAGVDYGRSRPFAVIYCAVWNEMVRPAGSDRYLTIPRIHVAHEVMERNLDCSQQADAVREAEKRWGLEDKRVLYYRDPNTKTESPSTGMGKTISQMWGDCGFFTTDAKTNARVPGWELVKRLIREQRITISPECPQLLAEMVAHQYAGSPGPPTSDDIQQGTMVMDDASDALRYCVVSVARLNLPSEAGSPFDPVTEWLKCSTSTLVQPVGPLGVIIDPSKIGTTQPSAIAAEPCAA